MKNSMIIKKNASKVLSTLIAFILLVTLDIVVFSTVASAHELKETSARITLRDGQVEIKLSTDIKRWQALLQDNKAWLMGDTEQVMPAGLNPKQNKEYLKKLLQKNTNISINNKLVALDGVSVSTLTEQHGHYIEIVLSGKHTYSGVDQLNIQFPKSLGAVHASIVQPQYKMMTPGSNAQIYFAPTVTKTTVAGHHH